MNCLDCGTVNPDDARFCGSCGHPIEGAKGPARQEEAKKDTSWDSFFKWIGIGVVGALVLGLLGIL
jgi:hypothetical protein